MTQNLARQARGAVEVFLSRKVTQESFAWLISSSVGTVRGWEQSRRIPRGEAAHTLLGLIVQNPEYMVPAIAQVRLCEALHFEVSFEIASEFVNLAFRGEATEEERRRAFCRALLKVLRAKKKAELGTYEMIEGMRCRVITITPCSILEK